MLASLISTVCAGVWDKQSAAFHKALAPGNTFAANVVFNSSRHGVNFQDSMGGEGLVANNVFFNLNRETTDTAALNSWCGKRLFCTICFVYILKRIFNQDRLGTSIGNVEQKTR
eukprot:COSAG06_NODE_7848_length_2353_cov_73.753327_1_plen_113_part_10